MERRPVRRYALMPDPPEERDGPSQPIRRFHLARIAVSPRSALGRDRHERMEEIARTTTARRSTDPERADPRSK